MKLSIIVLNYNTPELAQACIRSLALLQVQHEIIAVDNGSTQQMDSKNLPENCHYIQLEKNYGFGAGNNYGAKQATGQYLWFLNSDTLLVDHTPALLLDFLDAHPEVGAASPLLYNDRACRSLQPDFYANFQTLTRLVTRHPRPRLDLHQPYQLVDLVVGAALMIRRSSFEKIGGFDEKIFMYMEDDDLCYRLKEGGEATAVVTAAKVVHLQGKSVSRNATRKHLYYQSQNYFWQKHYGSLATLTMRALRLALKIFKTR